MSQGPHTPGPRTLVGSALDTHRLRTVTPPPPSDAALQKKTHHCESWRTAKKRSGKKHPDQSSIRKEPLETRSGREKPQGQPLERRALVHTEAGEPSNTDMHSQHAP